MLHEPLPCSVQGKSGYLLVATLIEREVVVLLLAEPDGSLGIYSIGSVKIDNVYMHNATPPVPTDQAGY